ncbi:hypothetical protein [Nostoc parmelioides]|uniref:Uncharacterized protein n=1 Tax=Nostoc parmelioides FACHB-3921 TaxID=2692909 RepID=A0ABR8BLG9_9NOSO|nr:hypothetical protein [Nostoc parmelioides]MBD2254716.1 hypothetical protein [Nostoc parmelioides FACHB-3921]
MTKINQNQQNLTLQAIKVAQGLNEKLPQAIPVIGSGNATYQVDITPVLLQNPYSPFAISLSIAIVIGALAGFIRTLKSR